MTSAGPLSWAPELEEDEPRPAGLPPFPPGTNKASGERGSVATGGALRALREIPLLAAAAVLAAFLLRTFVFQAFYIPSPSMGCAGCSVNTLEINDKIIVSKLSYRLHEPRRGDIVVFDCPPAAACVDQTRNDSPLGQAWRWAGERVGIVPPSTEDYIKRVVALPGESVEIRDGYVIIDGQPLIEPYLPPDMVTNESATVPSPFVVPEGHLWVMGDNRGNSSDSRVFQAIATDSVVGRAVAVFWPPRRAGFL